MPEVIIPQDPGSSVFAAVHFAWLIHCYLPFSRVFMKISERKRGNFCWVIFHLILHTKKGRRSKKQKRMFSSLSLFWSGLHRVILVEWRFLTVFSLIKQPGYLFENPSQRGAVILMNILIICRKNVSYLKVHKMFTSQVALKPFDYFSMAAYRTTRNSNSKKIMPKFGRVYVVKFNFSFDYTHLE